MRRFLLYISIFLLLPQLFILITLTLMGDDFLKLSLEVANEKIQTTLEHEINEIENNSLFRLGKKILSEEIKDIDSEIDSLKYTVKQESKQLLDELNSERISLSKVHYLPFSITKVFTDEEYCKDYIRGHLVKSIKNLKRDLIIVFGTNTLTLLLVFLVLLKFPATKVISTLSWIGIISVILSSACYFLGQDWLYRILMDAYLGYMYSAFVGVIFLLLCDIRFNRGGVILSILGNIEGLFGDS